MGPEKVRFQPAQWVTDPKAGGLQVALQALVRGWEHRPDGTGLALGLGVETT